ncbi:phage tail protein [Burkholderia sp. Bp9126]|nr:phage tail protein [Burkholderia sp. Bp9126]
MIDLLAPSVSHRFLATFSFNGIPSPVDVFFQRVSGLSRELSTTPIREGGDNVGVIHLPEKVEHGQVSFERAVMTITPLTLAFDQVMTDFDARHLSVVIMLLNHLSLPVCSWTLIDALPVRWRTGDLDANSNAILINELGLSYREMHWMGVKA